MAGENADSILVVGGGIAGQRPDSRIAQEEAFGPLLSVIPCTDEAEAVTIANGVRYRLTASVWTRDIGREESLEELLSYTELKSINVLY